RAVHASGRTALTCAACPRVGSATGASSSGYTACSAFRRAATTRSTGAAITACNEFERIERTAPARGAREREHRNRAPENCTSKMLAKPHDSMSHDRVPSRADFSSEDVKVQERLRQGPHINSSKRLVAPTRLDVNRNTEGCVAASMPGL